MESICHRQLLVRITRLTMSPFSRQAKATWLPDCLAAWLQLAGWCCGEGAVATTESSLYLRGIGSEKMWHKNSSMIKTLSHSVLQFPNIGKGNPAKNCSNEKIFLCHEFCAMLLVNFVFSCVRFCSKFSFLCCCCSCCTRTDFIPLTKREADKP